VDVETLRRELTFWLRERENMGRRAEEVKSAPLGETVAKQDKRLEEADDEIASMRKKIQSVKAAIHRNDGKIAKLLAMVVTPA
jgi:TRAF3-interacting protein 1